MSIHTCAGSIRTDSSGNWWHCDSGFVDRSEAEMVALLEASGAITPTEPTSPTQSLDPTQIDNWLAALDRWLTFDPALYGIITSGMLLLFVMSWGAGIGVKTLSRQ